MDNNTQYSTVSQKEPATNYSKAADHLNQITSTPPKYRRLRTVCMFVCFTALGIGSSIVGPTLVHMRHILNVDIAVISLTFTCGRMGFLIGSSTCGVIYDRFNPELQLFLCTLLIGIITITMPYAPAIYVYFALNAMQSFNRGFLDTAAHPYIITLWAGHRLKDPMMQAMHAVWSVGSAIGPFIAAPFLTTLPMSDNENRTMEFNETSQDNTTYLIDEIVGDNILRVRYSFLCAGILIALTSVSFIVPYLLLGPSCFISRSSNDISRDTRTETLPKGCIRTILFLQFFAFLSYVMYEAIPGEFLTAFVIEGLHWEVYKGPWITGIYWGSNAIGRIVNTLLSYCLSPSVMLTIALTLTSLAFILMFLATVYMETLLWIAVAMAGFAMSGTFASSFLWNSKIMEITGAVSGIFLAAGSTGGMSGSAITGYLFDNYTHMWVVYLCLIACSVHVFVFVLSSAMVKFSKNKILRN